MGISIQPHNRCNHKNTKVKKSGVCISKCRSIPELPIKKQYRPNIPRSAIECSQSLGEKPMLCIITGTQHLSWFKDAGPQEH